MAHPPTLHLESPGGTIRLRSFPDGLTVQVMESDMGKVTRSALAGMSPKDALALAAFIAKEAVAWLKPEA